MNCFHEKVHLRCLSGFWIRVRYVQFICCQFIISVEIVYDFQSFCFVEIVIFGWGRHFSHVTKSRIFRNLNLRKKPGRNLRGTFLENRFRHLKLYSNSPSWLARSRCHMDTFWKTKDWSSYFWESQPFKFWYVKIQRQRKLKSTKTGIFS